MTETTIGIYYQIKDEAIKLYCEDCKPTKGAVHHGTLVVSGYDNFCSGCGEDFRDIAEKETQAMATVTPGTLVVCQTRMPSVLQPWIHEVYVGVIVQPGTDPAQWNGSNSEQSYCDLTGTVPVQYPFGIQHDKIDSLIAITDEEAQYSFREKVGYFLGRVALTNYDRAMGIKEEPEPVNTYFYCAAHPTTTVEARGNSYYCRDCEGTPEQIFSADSPRPVKTSIQFRTESL